ncbi:LCP family protein [Pseudonocardia alaniniphila]|uniref:LCP family protein n=1 Tax=Pseudonocardia alaniniphila TaxID=75291 RepID=A0ABS9TV00_9PSEU|nr:LCP family protein [Pseudonocardia alaniniphila]MCH6172228.1 LCP family protein [Pseudonocardia alaniniphila]
MAKSTTSRRRGGRILQFAALGVALLSGLVVASVFLLTERIADNIVRIPAFDSLAAGVRPPDTAALTVLLIGDDTRVEPSAQGDAVLLVQLSADRDRATIVALPDDSWVEIPGRGAGTIASAYSEDDPSPLVGAVEQLTAVHIDHVATVDFARFGPVVDATRGIDLPQAGGHLDGAAALVYVRPQSDSDLGRAERQQDVLRAVFGKLASPTPTDPPAYYELLEQLSRSLRLDATISDGNLRSVALMAAFRRPGVMSLVAPVADRERYGTQSVAHLDPVRSAELWTALRSDETADYAALHPQDLLDAASG